MHVATWLGGLVAVHLAWKEGRCGMYCVRYTLLMQSSYPLAKFTKFSGKKYIDFKTTIYLFNLPARIHIYFEIKNKKILTISVLKISYKFLPLTFDLATASTSLEIHLPKK